MSAHPTVLITGSARRIGAEIAKHLHQNNLNVIIHCHHAVEQGNKLCQQLNDKRAHSAWLIQQDLAKANAAQVIYDQVKQLNVALHALINNASVFIKDTAPLDTVYNWQHQFLINAQVPYALSCTFRSMLAAHQGAIINLTDIHSQSPLKGYAIYCQSKAALLMQTKALAKEFAPAVRVNAIAPGAIAWPEADNALSDAQQQQIIAKTPLKKHGSPSFIAQAVQALLDNPFITGQQLCVDGGRSL